MVIYIKCDDVVFTVNVNWNQHSGQWNVNVWQYDDNRWNVGNQVFSPATHSKFSLKV